MSNAKVVSVVGAVIAGIFGIGYGAHWSMDGYRAAPAGEAIPSTFEMKETIGSRLIPFVPTTLQIVADGKSYGYVSRSVGHLTTQFDMTDQTGHKVAHGANEITALLTNEDVTDDQGHPIGKLSKTVTAGGLFTKSFSTYEISNAAGKPVATSDKSAVVVTDFILKDATTGEAVVTLSKGLWFWNPIRANWHVVVSKPGVVDDRIIAMIPAFKTYADNNKN